DAGRRLAEGDVARHQLEAVAVVDGLPDEGLALARAVRDAGEQRALRGDDDVRLEAAALVVQHRLVTELQSRGGARRRGGDDGQTEGHGAEQGKGKTGRAHPDVFAGRAGCPAGRTLPAMEISRSVFVASPPRQVYDLVSDLPRMGELSPENTGG